MEGPAAEDEKHRELRSGVSAFAAEFLDDVYLSLTSEEKRALPAETGLYVNALVAHALRDLPRFGESIARTIWKVHSLSPSGERFLPDPVRSSTIHVACLSLDRDGHIVSVRSPVLEWNETRDEIRMSRYESYEVLTGPHAGERFYPSTRPLSDPVYQAGVVGNDDAPPRASAAPGARSLRVFLSHGKEDKKRVRELHRRLQESGFEPWLDEEDLLPGQDWSREIDRAVKESDVFLACLSSRSVSRRGYIQKEITRALEVAELLPEGQIFVIPVRLDACQVPERLGRWQWLDVFDSDVRGFEALRESLRRVAEGRAVAPSAGAAAPVPTRREAAPDPATNPSSPPSSVRAEGKEKDRTDTLLEKARNNRLLSLLIVFGIVVIALGSFTEAVEKIVAGVGHLIGIAPESKTTPNLAKEGAVALTEEEIQKLRHLIQSQPVRFRDPGGDPDATSPLWPNGQTIHVAFLDGERAIQDFVMRTAAEWTKHANLEFVRVERAESAEARVTFKEPIGTYIGTEGLAVSPTEPTVRLGILTDTVDEDSRRLFTLHEFGHLLGLVHENQTPAGRERVDLSKAIGAASQMGWTEDYVRFSLSEPEHALAEYATKPWDPLSVMLLQVPADWYVTSPEGAPSGKLSAGDIAFIEKLYPR